ncbi:DNA polymerase III subunit delta [Hymenobacter busanensis]|uniref:DNA polymerase III subunit delta n=1 Tax=Hymenobacter busanensis TaxID=2607656 RepID=A0A7L4ZSV2_9BACT|nr:DNA polymerase III subunit delta [Hymenobacter busanensis]KAA9339828.1 DNA polymerase III subunit delta [Hymenobacter busanensis]QHJ06419.1 DNA polymerase III subunit delta [Hymenobacter busanensis]
MPALSADQLMQQLQKRQFAPVYFLQGEEPYYIDLASDFIEKNVLSEADKGFNQVVLYGKDTDVATVLGQARRFPMMAERTVVIVKEAQNLPGLDTDNAATLLEAYLKNPLPSTVLVFGYKHKTLDGRKKLGKLMTEHAVLLTSDKLRDYQVPQWLQATMKQRQRPIHDEAVQLLSEYIGADLGRLLGEIQKIELNLKPGEPIDAATVQRLVGISKDYNIFELQKALVTRDILKANRIVQHFAANPKDNPLIPNLTLLFNFFLRLLQLHTLPNPTAADWKRLGIAHAFAQKEYQQAQRVFNYQRTRDIIRLIRRADLQSKGVDSGSMEDGEILQELVFMILHPQVPVAAVLG